MLGADEIVPQAPRILDGGLEHPLAADGERNLGGGRDRRTGDVVLPYAPNDLARLIDGEAGPQIPAGRPVLGDEPQQQVLGKDHVFAERHGLPLREDNRLDRPLGEPLEGGGDGAAEDVGAPAGAGGGAAGEGGGEAEGEEAGAAVAVEVGGGGLGAVVGEESGADGEGGGGGGG